MYTWSSLYIYIIYIYIYTFICTHLYTCNIIYTYSLYTVYARACGRSHTQWQLLSRKSLSLSLSLSCAHSFSLLTFASFTTALNFEAAVDSLLRGELSSFLLDQKSKAGYTKLFGPWQTCHGNPFDVRVQDATEYPTVLVLWCVDSINPQSSLITRSGPLFLPPNGSSRMLDRGLSRIFDVRTREDART